MDIVEINAFPNCLKHCIFIDIIFFKSRVLKKNYDFVYFGLFYYKCTHQ